jgi:hypothetical protein
MKRIVRRRIERWVYGLPSFLALFVALIAPTADAGERLLVWARAGVTDRDLGQGLAPYRMSRQRLGRHGWHVLTLPAGTRPSEMQRRLSGHPLFQHVEMDRQHALSEVYNDTFYSSLWHLDRLAAPTAWAAASGMGRGITVAVVDTGVQGDHPDLAGALVSGWNVVENSTRAGDSHGHGTSVAGLLAARINNGLGVAGLAAGARIMPVRVSQPDGSARTSDIAMGIQWATERGARIVNVSYEGVMDSMVIRSAAETLFRQGGLLVAAAGNRGEQQTHPVQPGLMVVGAVDQGDRRPAWSNHGPHLALAAPGDGLWTTGLGGGYRVVWGTSFAAPLVAAAAALVWEAAPDATAAQIEHWLRRSAIDLGEQGPDDQTGHGRLNAGAAVAEARRWQTARAQTTENSGTSAGSVGGNQPGAVSTGTSFFGAANTGTSVALGKDGAVVAQPPVATPAWLGVDVDASALPMAAVVVLAVNGRTILEDAERPFAFSINLLDHPRGVLTLSFRAHDATGALIGSGTQLAQNNHVSLALRGVALQATEADGSGSAPHFDTARSSAPRRPLNARDRR